MGQIMQITTSDVITLKLWQFGKKVKVYRSSKTKRIYAKLKADIFDKAYLKVNYGKHLSSLGKQITFCNEGSYKTKSDLLHALKAFTENDKTCTDNSPARNLLSE